MALTDAVIATIRSTEQVLSPLYLHPEGIYHPDVDLLLLFARRSHFGTRYVVGAYCCPLNMADPEANCGCEKPDQLDVLGSLGLMQLFERRSVPVDLRDLR